MKYTLVDPVILLSLKLHIIIRDAISESER